MNILKNVQYIDFQMSALKEAPNNLQIVKNVMTQLTFQIKREFQ